MTETDKLAEMARSALLAEVRGSVLRLLAELPRLPARLKVALGTSPSSWSGPRLANRRTRPDILVWTCR